MGTDGPGTPFCIRLPCNTTFWPPTDSRVKWASNALSLSDLVTGKTRTPEPEPLGITFVFQRDLELRAIR